MGKRGPKPAGKVRVCWSADLAYAVGLIAADGCLYGNGRTIALVSKDPEQIRNFQAALGTNARIGKHISGAGRRAYKVQISDVLFYRFLLSIGLTSRKSKTIRQLEIPDICFFDFIRGVFDGDGSTYSYHDPRWPSSFLFYLQFASASPAFLDWIREEIGTRLGVRGHITGAKGHSTLQLKYGKQGSVIILRAMYHSRRVRCLSRKRLKIRRMLAIVGERL